MRVKTVQERADEILATGEFEVTTMGYLGHRYDDPNHIRGFTVGKFLRLIENAINDAVEDDRKRRNQD